MGKYEEDVYGRAEMKFSSLEKQIQWLSSFAQKGGNEYEQAAVEVATQLSEAKGIRQKASSSKSIETLESLKLDALDIPIKTVKEETMTFVETRIIKLRKIQDESKLAQQGATEKRLRSEIKKAESESELADILREAEDEVSDSGYNRLLGNTQQRQKVLNFLKSETARLERERLSKERKAFEKEEKRLQKIQEEKEEQERKEEARRIQREGQARKEAEREAQRELQRQLAREQENG